MKNLMYLIIFLTFPALSWAGGQHVIPDYDTARDVFFWSKLYSDGGKTFYCEIGFPPGGKVTVEHVFPAGWIATFHGCKNRNTCEHRDYKRAAADLHNLWPANGRINSSRSDLAFREIPGESARRFTKICPDFERTSARGGATAFVEPQDSVKGEIARSLLYMNAEYGLPLKGMLPMLKRWDIQDPPQEAEHLRNDKINELQGLRNRFIDNFQRGNEKESIREKDCMEHIKRFDGMTFEVYLKRHKEAALKGNDSQNIHAGVYAIKKKYVRMMNRLKDPKLHPGGFYRLKGELRQLKNRAEECIADPTYIYRMNKERNPVLDILFPASDPRRCYPGGALAYLPEKAVLAYYKDRDVLDCALKINP